MAILEDGIKQLGLEYTNRQLKLINKYINEIELWNNRYGLVNAKGDTLITKHILDSLTGVEYIEAMNCLSLADVGSGAGLPGIPLSILLPHMQISLIERSGKRVRFLRSVKALLGLENLTVIEADLKNVTEKFDLVTFRAFKPIEPEILGLLLNLLKSSGKLVAYKGKMENINQEIELVDKLATAENVIPVSVPGLKDERNLVVYSANRKD